MNKSPAFQFYPQDYLASARVAEMTLEEEGAYIRLLCYCWTTGSIPSDPDRCARLIGKGCSTAVATAVQLAFNGCSTDPQRMTHDRLEKEREKQLIYRKNASVAGKKSAEARAAKSSTETTKNVRSTTVQRKVNSSSSSSDEDVCDSKSQVDQFAEFWSIYPRKVAKPNALKAWKKALRSASPEQIISGAERYAKLMTGKDAEYIAHPATWINGARWEDEISAASPKRDPFGALNALWDELQAGRISDAEYNQRYDKLREMATNEL